MSYKKGALKCWNNNKKNDGSIPQLVTGMKTDVTAVSIDYWFKCAIQKEALKCWGSNNVIPQIVKGMETGVTAISLARSYACAIQKEALKCWGNNKFGQLGNGTKKESLTPQIVKEWKLV